MSRRFIKVCDRAITLKKFRGALRQEEREKKKVHSAKGL
jgi:hypothetical protein